MYRKLQESNLCLSDVGWRVILMVTTGLVALAALLAPALQRNAYWGQRFLKAVLDNLDWADQGRLRDRQTAAAQTMLVATTFGLRSSHRQPPLVRISSRSSSN